MTDKPLNVESMVASKSGEPYVMLRLGEEYVQMEPQKARTVARWLMEAAESATADAFLVEFISRDHDKGGEPYTKQAAAVLKAFREYREKGQSEKEGQLP